MPPEPQARDIYRHQDRYGKELDSLQNDERIDQNNREVIASYLRDARAGRLTNKHRVRRLSVARCRKILCILKLCAIQLRDPFASVTVDQMEAFILGLEDGQVLYTAKNGTQRAYSRSTVLDIKKILRGFFRWLLKDDQERLEKLTSWFDMREVLPEMRAFTLKDAQKMCIAAPSLQSRAMIMLLIDSGARISELLNVNCEDCWFEVMEDRSELAFMRIRISKTRPRTVSLPIATELLKQWLVRHPAVERIDEQGRAICKQPDQPVIGFSYNYIQRLLGQLGEQEIGWRVTPHAFRRSSASLFARSLSAWALAARMGWAQGSRVPARYIDSSGMVGVEAAHAMRAELQKQSDGFRAAPSVQPGDPTERIAKLLRKNPELAQLIESALR